MTDIKMPSRKDFVNIIGNVYNRLTVLSYAGKKTSHQLWLCRCECGNTIITRGDGLKSGHATSCGCFHKEQLIKSITKHDSCYTFMYKTYKSMLQRCNNPNHRHYHRYGGRGIKVCDKWQGDNGFLNFYADMGDKPSPKHSIDRIDNNLGYFKENCRWATQKQQNSNKVNNVFVEINGEKFTVAEACRLYNKPLKMVSYRLRKGLSIEEAFMKKSQRDKSNAII